MSNLNVHTKCDVKILRMKVKITCAVKGSTTIKTQDLTESNHHFITIGTIPVLFPVFDHFFCHHPSLKVAWQAYLSNAESALLVKRCPVSS